MESFSANDSMAYQVLELAVHAVVSYCSIGFELQLASFTN